MPAVYPVGQNVATPYGNGIVTKAGSVTPAGEAVVPAALSLRSWKLANGTSPTLYTSTTTWPEVVPPVEEGCDVKTQYGRGRVEALVDGRATVLLTEWRLAGSSRVRCYLDVGQCTFVERKKFNELTGLEKIDEANVRREKAKAVLGSGDFSGAAELYKQACFYLQTVDNDSLTDNASRASLLECMIACKNNAAMCCNRLKQSADAAQFANDAVLLLDAIYKQRGLKIHAHLNSMGLSDTTLFHAWRSKGLLYGAQARAETKDFTLAVELLKRCIALTAGVDSLKGIDAKAKKLMVACKQSEEILRKRERKAAKKMFNGGGSPKKKKEGSGGSPERAKGQGEGDGKAAVKEEALTAGKPSQPNPSSPSSPSPPSSLFPPSLPPHPPVDDDAGGGSVGFFEEHMELIILAGLGAIAVGAVAFFRGRNK
mmetsp:Transcript_17227/g.34532  ORF Transcript_17227/g.34532 Transcript_17227/m.34532 type:complete len:427 (+) Transcript_17227:180-1460(+)|eukprot:CAMPEP_0182477364 /NCGR_PEP_ID=MMETSP1319-20130603/30763_1 /TAXON_ID=172717 /ORGANISM="Bolidomonas pacifica, Strain RCC208" /LENGTH=426 /DNA_ID=CAMNT_0024678579 /DNA_START=123 /DNA_END=1403 /DNA_ORIENTATION=+